MKSRKYWVLIGCLAVFQCVMGLAGQSQTSMVTEIFKSLPESPEWRLLDKIKPQFNAHHPQGMLKIGEYFYLSSVERLEKTKKLHSRKTGHDQTPGKGVGHFIQFDGEGKLIRQMTLGEGAIYHPGGIDYDGEWIWVPVAEYRPHSQSIIYKINRDNWQAVEAFRVPDHIGAIAYNKEKGTLIGVNWDTESFYEWSLDGQMKRKILSKGQSRGYQDCKSVADQKMLCTVARNKKRGGIELVDLKDFSKIRVLDYVPRTSNDVIMTKNPMAIEHNKDRLTYYFLPEDRAGSLYVYQLH